MNRSLISCIAILSLLVIVNIPPIKWLWGIDDCRYSTDDGAFTFVEANLNGRDLVMCNRKFEDFKIEHPNNSVLYRLCAINGLCFWKYGDYLFSKKYRMPYKSWEDIDRRRGELVVHSEFQDF